jgi:hypothetical protein
MILAALFIISHLNFHFKFGDKQPRKPLEITLPMAHIKHKNLHKPPLTWVNIMQQKATIPLI